MGFVDLTLICSSDVFAEKRHVAPRLNLVNVQGLNKVLRSKIFISEDRQLLAVHLILDFEPLSNQFQNAGQTIRAGDPRLARIDVSVPGFLAQEDLPPVELPSQRIPCEVAIPREETTSSRLSLKAEIDQFHLKEEGKALERPMELSNSEVNFDRSSATHPPKLVVARIDNNSEEEKDMALNSRKGLKDLVAGRNKGSPSREVLKSQVADNLPPPPPPPTTSLSLIPLPNLKKKRKEQKLEKGEVVPQKEAK